MKYTLTFALTLVMLFSAVAPTVAYALPGIVCHDGSENCLVPCDGATTDPNDPKNCDFDAFMQLIRNLMTYGVYMSIPIAAIAFAYAGWLYMSAHTVGSVSDIGKANRIFTTVLKGFIFIIAGWLIVYTIVSVLLDKQYYEDFLGITTHTYELS